MIEDTRTETQKTADAKLEQAILESMQAYELIDDGAILNDFLVLCTTSQIDGDGVVKTNYPCILPNGDIPWYRVVGLLKIHQLYAEAMIIAGRDNG